MRIGYLDCFSGASGDMIVGSIIDAGCKPEFIQAQLDLLKLPAVKLVTSTVKKHGLKGTSVCFQSSETAPPDRHLSTISNILQESALATDVIEKAIAILRRIGKAEAKMHDMPLEKVHFHELGAVDAICDIVAAVVGFQELGIERLYSSTILLGSGIIESAHGMIPIPAPATQEIVKGFPVRRIDSGAEMTTPTGAAIITELAEYSPGFEILTESVGYGAGRRDYADRPNLLRLIVGSTQGAFETDEVAIIETNIDDTTPEQIGYLYDILFGKGALDVFVTNILMKKSRPGFLLSVICRRQQAEELSALILRESSTTGVRLRTEKRRKLMREVKEVSTCYGKIRIKFLSGGDIHRFSPEYDDIVAAAATAGVPFARVYQVALQAAGKIEGEQK